MKMSALCFGLVLMIAFQNPIKNIFYFGQFHEFLELVPDADLPYKLDFEDLNRNNKDLYPDYRYYMGTWGNYEKPTLTQRNPFKYKRTLINKFIGPGMVRVIPKVLPVLKFQPSKEQYAVVYAHAYLNRQWFFLQTFDNHGNKLRRFHLTGNSETTLSLCSINSDGIIKIREYEKIWKHEIDIDIDIQRIGIHDIEIPNFENNEVVDHKLIKTQYFKIDKTGEVILIEDSTEFYQINEFGKSESLKKTEEKILNDPPLTINK